MASLGARFVDLAHLDGKRGMSPKTLAQHLDVAPSTLSATIARLIALGCVASRAAASDKRQHELRLTSRGARAMAATSVLETSRVKALVALLTPAEREAAAHWLGPARCRRPEAPDGIMKILLLTFVALFVLIGLVLLIGAFLPREHRVSREIALNAPPAQVYAVVRDFASAPSWRHDLRTVEMWSAENGRVRFRECAKNGCVNYEVREEIPGEKLVTRILNRNLGYEGSWSYEFGEAAQGTRLRITETGEVSNLFFRFMSRFVFGQASTIDNYLKSLGKRFGLEVTPK